MIQANEKWATETISRARERRLSLPINPNAHAGAIRAENASRGSAPGAGSPSAFFSLFYDDGCGLKINAFALAYLNFSLAIFSLSLDLSLALCARAGMRVVTKVYAYADPLKQSTHSSGRESWWKAELSISDGDKTATVTESAKTVRNIKTFENKNY